jgi:pSer/pThr/pTyr-binding forkhead associated (FHA) protein
MTSEATHSHLLIIEDDKGRREIELNKPIYSLGRDRRCDIRIWSQFVSRLHATLIQLPQPDGFFFYRILDGSVDGKPSSNGILINGRKVQSSDLKNSDEIVFGPKVQAIYYVLRPTKVNRKTLTDEFDITLISPNMLDDDPSDSNDGGDDTMQTESFQ